MLNITDRLKKNIPLKNYTTLNIGGPALYFIEATSEEELIAAVKFAKEENIPYLIIGNGSNLLVADQGFPGLIIKNSFRGITEDKNLITSQSGTNLEELVNFSLNTGLSGMQKLIGIPGTLGGAIYGNAGAYGQTISDCLEKITCLDPQNLTQINFTKAQCQFDYRDSIFKRNHFIILSTEFKFTKTDKNILQKEASETLSQRAIKYPPNLKCPGSFFKNILAETVSKELLKNIPPEKIVYGKIPAGYLLESVGGKGEKLGNVQVSSNHGNLIINLGEGTAEDFYQLTHNLANKVRNKFGISLEPEVQLINLPPL